MLPSRSVLLLLAVGGAVLLQLPAQTTWQAFTSIQSTPQGRNQAGLAYDSHRHRTVLFGGQLFGGADSNQTWVKDGSNWTLLTPPSSPPVLAGTNLVYDSARQRIVLFGGGNSLMGFSNQTWEFDGTFWVQRTPSTSPPARGGGAHAYDPVRQRFVLFGGWNGTRMNDTWEYDGTDWYQVVTAHTPSGRSDMLAAYDEGRNRMVMHGGYNDVSQFLGDTWEYDGVDWTQVATTSSAGPLADAAITYDRGLGRIVMFGGKPSWFLPQTNQTFLFDGTNWTDITASVGAGPSGRWGPRAVYDERRGRCVVFGGIDNFNQFPGDTWELVTTNVAKCYAYGSGCAGSGGTPQLLITANEMPRFGGAWNLTLQNFSAVPIAFCTFGLSDQVSGFGPLPVPLAGLGMPGCSLYVSPDLIVTMPVLWGTATVGLAIPNQTALLGLPLFAQGLVLDAAANAAGLIVSDAAGAQVGF
jgi:hypothetical protein